MFIITPTYAQISSVKLLLKLTSKHVEVVLILILLICTYVDIIISTLTKTSFCFTYFPVLQVFTSCKLYEKT
jgi:hypothetical protein